jgi:hypothetical protein
MNVNMEKMDSSCCTSQSIPLVPLPMAVLGMMMALMFGMIMGRKREMMMHGGQGGMMKHGSQGGMMMHGSKKHHHHHGDGAACCCEQPGDRPEPEAPPAA